MKTSMPGPRAGAEGKTRHGRVVTLTLALMGIMAAGMPSAEAQGPWWGWGPTPGQSAAWDPSRFSDFLLTGQEPHPAVTRIVAPEDAGTALGSGVLVDVNRSQGLVLTNWHVVRDSRSALLVQFPDGFQSAGTVVRWDEAWDLAAVVIWKPTTQPVTIATQPPTIGEPLTIAGFGRGAYREETGPCTDYLSPGTGYGKEFVEVQATARQGDSGGAIFNGRRELAGILFGQAEGRTIGSCSSRVRTFLTTVGSRGFTPVPIAEFSDGPAIARGVGAPATLPSARLASSDTSIERSTHVANPVPAVAQYPDQQPFHTMPPNGAGTALIGQPSLPTSASHAMLPADAETGAFSRHTRSIPTALLRAVVSEGDALLSGAGGIALVAIGLRVVFGGRRFRTPEDE